MKETGDPRGQIYISFSVTLTEIIHNIFTWINVHIDYLLLINITN